MIHINRLKPTQQKEVTSATCEPRCGRKMMKFIVSPEVLFVGSLHLGKLQILKFTSPCYRLWRLIPLKEGRNEKSSVRTYGVVHYLPNKHK